MSLFYRTIRVVSMVAICGFAAAGQRPGPQFRRPVCEPIEPRTKLEALDWSYERVLVKGFSQIAIVGARGANIRVDAVDLKDADSGVRAMGLVIGLTETSENPHENRSFVDYDEIDKLLRAIDAVARANESITKLASFEARYRTPGDFEVSVFRQSRSGAAVSISSGVCDRVTGVLTLDDLDRLKAHIVEAKARLDEIK